jgi:HNH endonuclease
LAVTVDHIIPLSEGGTNRKHNLVYSCCVCNNLKSHKSLRQLIDGCRTRVNQGRGYKGLTPERLLLVIKNAQRLIDNHSEAITLSVVKKSKKRNSNIINMMSYEPTARERRNWFNEAERQEQLRTVREAVGDSFNI